MARRWRRPLHKIKKKLPTKPETDERKGKDIFEFANFEIIATPLDSTDVPMT